MTEFHAVNCIIERGGFSSERTFQIKLANEEMAVGTANVEYLRTKDWGELDDETPAYGEAIEGYVMCRVIERINENTVKIDVPSFDLVIVPQDILTDLYAES